MVSPVVALGEDTTVKWHRPYEHGRRCFPCINMTKLLTFGRSARWSKIFCCFLENCLKQIRHAVHYDMMSQCTSKRVRVDTSFTLFNSPTN